MAELKIVRVGVGQDGDKIDWKSLDDVAVIVGERGTASTGTQGVSYAGAHGEAISARYGIAIVGPNGTAIGGAGTVVCAYDGGTASGGDGAVAWARRNGAASTGIFGIATVIDSKASGGNGSIAVALRPNAKSVSATVETHGVAVVHNHPELNPASGPALAVAGANSVAIAFDGNSVQGAVGALLVANIVEGGKDQFAVAVVDGVNIKANTPYRADKSGKLIPA